MENLAISSITSVFMIERMKGAKDARVQSDAGFIPIDHFSIAPAASIEVLDEGVKAHHGKRSSG